MNRTEVSSQELHQVYLEILKSELVPALGCTEPIAIAYASAKAREVLGCFPERMELYCSGNIIKNVKGVTVPCSGGMRGMESAAILGVVGGDASQELEVLSAVEEDDLKKTRQLVEKGYCVCHLQEGVENLFVRAIVYAGNDCAEVTIQNRHNQIVRIVHNGAVLYDMKEEASGSIGPDKSLLSVRGILDFANHVPIKEVTPVLKRQVEMNSAIAEEGMRHSYGVQVGRTLMRIYGSDVKTRAKARAAAGSDARMNGCPLPVVINSGSGNQGMTVSLPVIEFAKELGVSREMLYRALVVSNLIAIHQKKYIGSLSAYCGAVSAACGAGAAITYLYGGGYEEISATIVNTIANIGGMVCDGAKSSCAAKIASAVDAAIMAHFLSNSHLCFQPGEGLVQNNVEETIESLGYIGRIGMKETDVEILNMMLDSREKLDELQQIIKKK